MAEEGHHEYLMTVGRERDMKRSKTVRVKGQCERGRRREDKATNLHGKRSDMERD